MKVQVQITGKVITQRIGCVGFVVLPMSPRHDTAIDNTFINGQTLSNFHNINLSCSGPPNFRKVGPQSPKGRPQSIGDIGNLNRCLYRPIHEHDLVFGCNSSRCKIWWQALRNRGAERRKFQVSSLTNAHIGRITGICLKLLIAPSIRPCSNIVTPIVHIQRSTRRWKIVDPQDVPGCGRDGGGGCRRHEKDGKSSSYTKGC